jgi:adenylate cyclase
MTTHRRLAAILVADVVGYSRLMEADETGTLAALKERRKAILAPTVRAHGGRVVKFMGDAVLVEFASAVKAVEAALELQGKMAEANVSMAQDRGILLRIGINLGDVIGEGADIYGDGVNIAARLEALAQPGGICLSDKVQKEVSGKLPVAFDDLGERQLKNIAAPVRVFTVRAGSSGHAVRIDNTSRPDKPSIVVLPFENMSGDIEQNYFSEGISEDIITDLSKISGLFVIARNSAFTYKGRPVKVQEVSRELGVRYVLEGGVRKAGNRLRITAQLIDGHTGGHVWAERYDRDLTDIFAVQDEVTQKIVAALAVKLSGEERRRLETHGTEVVGAYDYLLRGRHEIQVFTKAANTDARHAFEQAIALDRKFSSAVACLAKTHMYDYTNRWSEAPDESLATAYRLASQAVALDPGNAEAHEVLGDVFHWMKDLDRAIAAREHAIALDPNYAHAYAALGYTLYYAGQPERGLECLRHAVRLDPLHPDEFLHFLALNYFALGRLEEAAAVLERRLIRNPNTDVSRILLASIYGHQCKHEKARGTCQEALKVNPAYSLEERRRMLPFRDPPISSGSSMACARRGWFVDGRSVFCRRRGTVGDYLSIQIGPSDRIKAWGFDELINGTTQWGLAQASRSAQVRDSRELITQSLPGFRLRESRADDLVRIPPTFSTSCAF